MRRYRAALALALVTIALLCAPARPASAHPMGNFSINHFSALTIAGQPHAGTIVRLLYVVDLAEIPTFQELSQLGVSQAADLSPGQRASYRVREAAELSSGLQLRSGGQAVPLHLQRADLLFPPGAAGLATERLYLVLTAHIRASVASLEYTDSNFPGRAGWKEIVVEGSGGMRVLNSSVPKLSRSLSLSIYPTGITSSPPQDTTASVAFGRAVAIGQTQPRWSLATPVLAASDTAGTIIHRAEAPLFGLNGSWSANAQRLAQVPTQSSANNPSWSAGRSDPLTDLMRGRQLTPAVLLLSLIIAFWFGAGHALSPGHGKTIVGAYLVGSKGTAAQAALLGLTVTITHTAGVFALGLVTLYFSRYIVPDQLYPWLGFTSGMLVALMGVTLFVRRLKAIRSSSQPTVPAIVPPVASYRRVQSFGGRFSYLPGNQVNVLATAHGHAHVGVAPTHVHGSRTTAALQPHRHGPFGKAHTHGPLPGQNGEKVTLRSLLALGISGGMLPCPSALVVLLSAIAFHRLAFGMLLIVAFSFGLASVLTGIGIAMVYSGRMMGRLQTRRGARRIVPLARKASRIMPVFSAFAVASLGTLIAIGALGGGFLPTFLTRL